MHTNYIHIHTYINTYTVYMLTDPVRTYLWASSWFLRWIGIPCGRVSAHRWTATHKHIHTYKDNGMKRSLLPMTTKARHAIQYTITHTYIHTYSGKPAAGWIHPWDIALSTSTSPPRWAQIRSIHSFTIIFHILVCTVHACMYVCYAHVMHVLDMLEIIPKLKIDTNAMCSSFK